jgi:Skp family chaperone for outer membrane proteins
VLEQDTRRESKIGVQSSQCAAMDRCALPFIEETRMKFVRPLALMIVGGLATASIVMSTLSSSAAAASAAPAPAGSPTGPAVVAVVDLERVFEEINLRDMADAALQQLADQLQADVESAKQAADLARADMEVFAPDSVEHREAQRKALVAVTEYQAQVQFVGERLNAQKARTLVDMYVAVKSAIATVSQQHNYDLVLLDDSKVDIPPGDETQVLQHITARRILYANGALDITDQIISAMNQQP